MDKHSKDLEKINWMFFTKLFEVLGKKFTSKFFITASIVIINAIIESASIYLFIPLTRLLTDPYYSTKKYFEVLNFTWDTKEEEVIIYLIFMLIIFLLKSIINLTTNIAYFNFIYKSQEFLSQKLLKSYIQRDYIYHSTANPTKLLTNCSTEIYTFTGNVLIPVINIISETFLISSVLLVLIFFDPFSTFILGIILILFGYIFLRLLKSRSNALGEERQKIESNKNSIINSLLRGFKFLVISKKLNPIYEEYVRSNQIFTKISVRHNVLLNLMKVISEPLIMLILVLIASSWQYSGKDLKDIIVLFSFLIVAIFRTLPSIFKLINGIQSIAFGLPSFNLIANELLFHSKKDNENENLVQKEVRKEITLIEISVDNISFKYDNTSEYIFKNFSLRIKKGERVELIGESGSGKTTLVDLITGLIKPDSGQITINTDKGDYSSLLESNLKIGYVEQNVFLSPGSIKNNIEMQFQDKLSNQDLFEETIRISDLSNLIESLPKKENTILNESSKSLSGGQTQRVGIARGIYGNPDVLILDEFTSALDHKTEERIYQKILQKFHDSIIILITHKSNPLFNPTQQIKLK